VLIDLIALIQIQELHLLEKVTIKILQEQ